MEDVIFNCTLVKFLRRFLNIQSYFGKRDMGSIRVSGQKTRISTHVVFQVRFKLRFDVQSLP